MAGNDDNIRIVADDRERSGAVTAILLKTADVEVTTARLQTGDYRVDGRLLVERKTLPDCALSIVDGRLFRQTIRLAASACRGVLILEGSGKDLAAVGVRREAMQGALITVSLVLGIPVLRAQDATETAWLILAAARQVRRAARGGFQRPWHRPAGKHARQVHLLQGLPGIGREKAERLLHAFGSVEAVFSATCENLEAVAGIGSKTARNIRWAVGEAMLPYGGAAGRPVPIDSPAQ